MTETPVKFKIDVTATDATALIAALHKAIERLSQNEVHLDATFLVDPVGDLVFRVQLDSEPPEQTFHDTFTSLTAPPRLR